MSELFSDGQLAQIEKVFRVVLDGAVEPVERLGREFPFREIAQRIIRETKTLRDNPGEAQAAVMRNPPTRVLYRPLGEQVSAREDAVLVHNRKLILKDPLFQVQLFGGLFDMWQTYDPDTDLLIPGLLNRCDPNLTRGVDNPRHYHETFIMGEAEDWLRKQLFAAFRADHGVGSPFPLVPGEPV